MSDLGTSVLGALDTLVLTRRSDGRFIRRGALPLWCRVLRDPAFELDVPMAIEGTFPFLGAFLPEGSAAFQRDGPPRVDSEFWTEPTIDGKEIHLKATALKVGEEDVLAITRDDSLFEEHQILLQRARDLKLAHAELAREMEQKDVLVHCIVHDLATPLQSILATLSHLDEQASDAPEAHWVDLALEAAKRQREMIQTILYVFSAEKATLEENLDARGSSTDVLEAMSSVAAELEAVARRRKVVLDVVSPVIPPGPILVVGDDARLARVLANLVDNALRYSPSGTRVQIVLEPQDDFVTFAVEDEGPGVPPDLAPQLFEKFMRRSGGGTGLGLYFCRITVERWGGKIGYERKPEGGSRFSVMLPKA